MDSASVTGKSPRTLIACALPLEAALLGANLPPGDWRLVATGLGGPRTRRRLEKLLADSEPRLLVFTGSAGALDSSLQAGDIVFPERWSFEGGASFECDPATVARLRSRGWRVEGGALSVTRPVVKAAERSRIFFASKARVCDLEAAAALETASRLGVPAIALKVVADACQDAEVAADPARYQDRLRQVIPTLANFLDRLLADLR